MPTPIARFLTRMGQARLAGDPTYQAARLLLAAGGVTILLVSPTSYLVGAALTGSVAYAGLRDRGVRLRGQSSMVYATCLGTVLLWPLTLLHVVLVLFHPAARVIEGPVSSLNVAPDEARDRPPRPHRPPPQRRRPARRRSDRSR